MAEVYLIPAVLAEDGYHAIHHSTIDTIKKCSVFFVENERTTRRYFKQLWKEYAPGSDIRIDDYNWYVIDENAGQQFKKELLADKTIGIVSEAGCAGIADPGQSLIRIAQDLGIAVRPLTGPTSILLALMASGMNGQQFQFLGYLPIDTAQRIRAIKELESESARKKVTQIFIETPYRNNQLFEALLKHCNSTTRICVAVDLTSKQENILTKKVSDWMLENIDLHKRPAIFLLDAG